MTILLSTCRYQTANNNSSVARSDLKTYVCHGILKSLLPQYPLNLLIFTLILNWLIVVSPSVGLQRLNIADIEYL